MVNSGWHGNKSQEKYSQERQKLSTNGGMTPALSGYIVRQRTETMSRRTVRIRKQAGIRQGQMLAKARRVSADEWGQQYQTPSG